MVTEHDSDEDGYDYAIADLVDELSESQKMMFFILFVNNNEDDDE